MYTVLYTINSSSPTIGQGEKKKKKRKKKEKEKKKTLVGHQEPMELISVIFKLGFLVSW